MVQSFNPILSSYHFKTIPQAQRLPFSDLALYRFQGSCWLARPGTRCQRHDQQLLAYHVNRILRHTYAGCREAAAKTLEDTKERASKDWGPDNLPLQATLCLFDKDGGHVLTNLNSQDNASVLEIVIEVSIPW